MSLPDVGIQVGALLNNAGTAMADIATHAFSVTVDRGGDRRIEQPDAGRCEIVLHNTTGLWDEGNSAGSATLIARGQALGVHVRASQTAANYREWIFCGRIAETYYDYDVSGQHVVRVVAYDGLYRAQKTPAVRSPFTLAGDSAGEAIKDLRSLLSYKETISAFEVLSYPTTDLDQGVTSTLATPLEPGRPALDYMRQIADGEQGWLYADQQDALIFQGRYDLAWGQSIEMTNQGTATAGTAHSPIPYQQLSATAGGFDLITECSASTRAVDGVTTGAVQVASAASTATYGANAVSLPELIVASDNQAAAAAESVVYRFGTLTWRPTSFTFRPGTLGTAVQSKLSFVDLLSPLPYSMTLPSGSAVTGTAVITRISHQITPGEHLMTYGCAVYTNPTGAGFFTLGASSLGGTEVLGI